MYANIEENRKKSMSATYTILIHLIAIQDYKDDSRKSVLEEGRTLTPGEVAELRRNARKADSYERLARAQRYIFDKTHKFDDRNLADYFDDQAAAIRCQLETTPKVEEEVVEEEDGNNSSLIVRKWAEFLKSQGTPSRDVRARC